ncbi:MAG: response regulator transcription factor [Clostridiaceae bacterium]|nr:response regulator transcription factor [Clostridiaceae bacterium]
MSSLYTGGGIILSDNVIRVVIADDSLIFREILTELLAKDPEISVVAAAGNGMEAFNCCREFNPDIVLMDIRMPECDGIEGTKLIKTHFPSIKIIVFTTFEDQDYITEAIRYGAEGYVLKDSGQDHIRTVIKSVNKGYPVFHEKALDTMVQSISEVPSEKVKIELSPTEYKILSCIVEGKSNKEIAVRLNLSEGRIRNIISDLFDRTGTVDRTQLAVFAVRNDLVD